MGLSLSLGFALSAIIFAVMGRQISAGTLTRNGDFGIRTRITKASDEAWVKAHAAAKPFVTLITFTSLALAVVTVVSGVILGDSLWLFAVAGAGYLMLLALIALMTVRAQRAALLP